MRSAKCFRLTLTAFAALAGAAATAPVAQAANICPQFVIKSCVFNNKTHVIFTTATNACFAKNQGLTVIYIGACKFGKP